MLLGLVIMLTVAAPSGTTLPFARGAEDGHDTHPRACIAAVNGLTPFGATGGRNAVLLVHGWTGTPDAWLESIDQVVSPDNRPTDRSLAEEIKRFGDTDVWIIDYYEDSFRWVTDERVAGPIGAAIDCLHGAYGTPIGYVAHSMGGLVLRQVIEGRQHKVGPIVTFGTPHLGSEFGAILLEVIDAAPDVAALFGHAVKRSANPLVSLGGYLAPVIVEYLVQELRDCGKDPFVGTCGKFPDFVAAAYSEAGLAMAAGSPQLVGSTDVTPLPTLPRGLDDRVLSLAGEISIQYSQSYLRPRRTGPLPSPVSEDGVILVSGLDGVGSAPAARVGDWVVGVSSALGSGIGREHSFSCPFYFVPNPATQVLTAFVPTGRSSERWIGDESSSLFSNACSHWKLTSAREPTQFALAFLHEHLRPDIAVVETEVSSGGSIRTVRGGAMEPVVVVLDTSGSMAERDPRGTVRMEGARAALRSLIATLPPTTMFELRRYPDPVRGTCNAGTSVIRLAPIDDGRVIGEIESIQPNGLTSTGPALRAAVDSLRRAGLNSGQVVLISDGQSNCGEPPCDAAVAIVAEGFDVTVNTLGFLISQEGQRELDCIASATGGLSLNASDADELSEYLLSLQSAQLRVAVIAPEAIRAGSAVEIEVSVGNDGGTDALDVRLALAVRGDSYSPVLPPSFMLGNIPAGGQVTRRWTVATDPGAVTGGPTSVKVIATSRAQGIAPVRADVEVTLDDRPVTADQAGGVLRDALGLRTSTIAMLGDGFSAGASGEGLSRRAADCGADPEHYGAVLYGAKVYNFACIDALISDVIRPTIGADLTLSLRAQVDGLSSLADPPSLVFLTLGMADSGILDSLLDCIEQPGSPSPGCGSDSRLVRTLLERIENLLHQRDALGVAYRAITDRMAEDGTLIVLAYPKMFSRSTPSCSGIDHATAQFTDHLIGELNNVIERAVIQARESTGRDIRFSRSTADAYLPTNTACDTDPFVAMPTLTSEGQFESLTAVFHPTFEGHRALALELIRWSQLEEARVATEPRRRASATRVRPDAPTEATGIAGEVTVVVGGDRESTTDHVIRPNEAHRVSADGFAPNSRVELRLESRPFLIGRTVVDGDGRLDVVFPVADDLVPGRHHLRITGLSADGSHTTVTIPLELRPSRPDWVPFALPAAALLAIASLLLSSSWSRSSESGRGARRIRRARS